MCREWLASYTDDIIHICLVSYDYDRCMYDSYPDLWLILFLYTNETHVPPDWLTLPLLSRSVRWYSKSSGSAGELDTVFGLCELHKYNCQNIDKHFLVTVNMTDRILYPCRNFIFSYYISDGLGTVLLRFPPSLPILTWYLRYLTCLLHGYIVVLVVVPVIILYMYNV